MSSDRQTGITTGQIATAPIGAVYIWVNSDTRYPKALARKLKREDLQFVGPSWLDPMNYQGRTLGAIILDHAAELTWLQWTYLDAALCYCRMREIRGMATAHKREEVASA